MQRLLIATRNRHKTREIAEMLGSGFAVEDLSDHPDFPEVDETGATFRENAVLKAEAASRHFGPDVEVMADDSGLEVDALDGAPGVRSARFAGEKATDRENLELLLARLKGVPADKRTARFRCVIALARGGQLLKTFDGVCEGRIGEIPHGSGGFGYDPVFIPEGATRTFAELSSEEKHRISHRARALYEALRWYRKAG